MNKLQYSEYIVFYYNGMSIKYSCFDDLVFKKRLKNRVGENLINRKENAFVHLFDLLTWAVFAINFAIRIRIDMIKIVKYASFVCFCSLFFISLNKTNYNTIIFVCGLLTMILELIGIYLENRNRNMDNMSEKTKSSKE